VTHDELEFLISQHLDGDLSPGDEARLQAALAADETARAVFAEHATIHAALRSTRDLAELADVDFAQLRANVNAAIDDVNATPIKLRDHPAWGGRLWKYASAVVAATVAIAIGVAAFSNRGGSEKPVANQPTGPGKTLLANNPAVPTNRESMPGKILSIRVGPLSAGGISVSQVEGPVVQLPNGQMPTVASVTLGQPVGIPESALLNLLVAERNPKRVVVAPGKR
jgi:hypothetical protein